MGAADLVVGVKQIAIRSQLIVEGVRKPAETSRDIEDCVWLALALVGEEEKDLVFHDRTADGPAELLIGERKQPMGHGIIRVEDAISKISVKCSVELVAARFGLHVHLNS